MENTTKEEPTEEEAKVPLYTKYPLSNNLNYNGTTLLHFSLGAVGIIVGYEFSSIAYLAAVLYLVVALAGMYVIMPLVVCPNCVYYGLKDSRCISGMNLVSRRISSKGDPKNFPNRGKGLFCHNNLYMASLFLPIVAMLPALVLNFSYVLLAIFASVVALLLYRFFIIFPKVACLHCRAKYRCPNAQAMGLHLT
ncbi:MAG: hypothetical protein ACXADX_12520 [Candidatus Hodarchaeales archaeon]|jgi:hypothetical protein